MHDVEDPVLYTADLERCTTLSRWTPDQLRSLCAGALERAGATIVESVWHQFPGAGVTCMFVLAESHAVVHTWPETGMVNVDVFSCSTRLRAADAISEIGASLGADDVVVRETPRRK